MIRFKQNTYYEIEDIVLQYFLKIYFGFDVRLKDIISNCEVGNYYVFKLQNSFVTPDIRYNIEGFEELYSEVRAHYVIRKELERLKEIKELEYQVLIYLLMNCKIIPVGDYVISITV